MGQQISSRIYFYKDLGQAWFTCTKDSLIVSFCHLKATLIDVRPFYCEAKLFLLELTEVLTLNSEMFQSHHFMSVLAGFPCVMRLDFRRKGTNMFCVSQALL
jgi:hypothetical protein